MGSDPPRSPDPAERGSAPDPKDDRASEPTAIVPVRRARRSVDVDREPATETEEWYSPTRRIPGPERPEQGEYEQREELP